MITGGGVWINDSRVLSSATDQLSWKLRKKLADGSWIRFVYFGQTVSCCKCQYFWQRIRFSTISPWLLSFTLISSYSLPPFSFIFLLSFYPAKNFTQFSSPYRCPCSNICPHTSVSSHHCHLLILTSFFLFSPVSSCSFFLISSPPLVSFLSFPFYLTPSKTSAIDDYQVKIRHS